MKITQFAICLVENKMLGFFWVGDAITYFELVYLPVVLLLMVLASLLIRQKDRRLSQSSDYSSPTVELTFPESPQRSASLLTAENSNKRFAEDSATASHSISARDGIAEIPQQIPA